MFERAGFAVFIVFLALSRQVAFVPAISAGVGAAAELSCPNGLVVHIHSPESPEASVLRMPSGLELRVSEPILKITGSMVREALISEYHQYDTAEERVRGTPTKRFFWVALRLNPAGAGQLRRAVGGKRSANLVMVCNGILLIGSVAGEDRIEEVSVLIDDSRTVAEQFARSLTPNVRFERYTPPPDQE
jgi:hypothetical protein